MLYVFSGLLSAQSTIAPSAQYAWTPNSGWTNFRANTTNGVVISDSFLSGNAWDANTGWISFGDGTPNNGHTYANNSASDYGVNHDGGGALTGYAYSANTGWVNFGWASSTDPNRPRINLDTGALIGYAWSANLGWIRLGSGFLTTSSIALIDTDMDGISDSWERRNFSNLTTATASSDFDADGQSDRNEFHASTLPRNSGSFLEIVSTSFNGSLNSATLNFTSDSSRRYRIHFSNDLLGPASWSESSLGLFSPDSGATTQRTFSFPTNNRKFFRVTAVRPLSN